MFFCNLSNSFPSVVRIRKGVVRGVGVNGVGVDGDSSEGFVSATS